MKRKEKIALPYKESKPFSERVLKCNDIYKARKEFSKFAVLLCKDDRFSDIYFKITQLNDIGVAFKFNSERFSVIADGKGSEKGLLSICSLDILEDVIKTEQSNFSLFEEDKFEKGYLTAEQIIKGFKEGE